VRIVWCGRGGSQRPFVFVAPMASYEDAAFRCFVGIASANDVNAQGRLAIHSVVNALQQMIKPSEVKRCKIERRVVGELGLPGVTEVFTAVDPRADDQALETLLGPAQFDEVYIRNLRSPGVIPARCVVFGHIFIFGEVVHDTRAGVLPEVVVVAVAHGFDQPGFVIGCELERSRAGAQRERANVLADWSAHVDKSFRGGWIGCSALRSRKRIWSSGRIAKSEDPVEEAQFEGSVMANAVASAVRHRASWNHGLAVTGVGDGHRVLRRSGVGRANRADATIAPGL